MKRCQTLHTSRSSKHPYKLPPIGASALSARRYRIDTELDPLYRELQELRYIAEPAKSYRDRAHAYAGETFFPSHRALCPYSVGKPT